MLCIGEVPRSCRWSWQLLAEFAARCYGTESQIYMLVRSSHSRKSSNKPDAVNPAMALWFAVEGQWRRVTDLERWA
jgi:hypothetical protein